MTPTDVDRANALRVAADPDIEQDLADLLVSFVLPCSEAGTRWAVTTTLRKTTQRIRDLQCGAYSIPDPGEDPDRAADREILNLKWQLGQTIDHAVEHEGDAARWAAYAARDALNPSAAWPVRA